MFADPLFFSLIVASAAIGGTVAIDRSVTLAGYGGGGREARSLLARKLDDCCSKLSGEHVIAVNAWPGENRDEKARTKIRFQRGNLLANGSLDMSAPGGFNREHTVNTATRNVLCVDHNTRLSVVDDEAGVLTDAMLRYWETRQKRAVPGLPYARKEFHVDGPRLERWFIKSVITYAIDDGLPIGSPEVGAGMPTDELVDIAYGLANPSGFIGLFGAPILHEPTNETNEYEYSFMTWHSCRRTGASQSCTRLHTCRSIHDSHVDKNKKRAASMRAFASDHRQRG